MQHYTLELFRKDDTRFELRVLDGTWLTFPLIEQAEMNALLVLAATDYRVNAPDLVSRGQALFAWVDAHSHGWLRRVRQQAQAMALVIDVREAGLRHLPWELLHDGAQFLCAEPIHLFTPLRLVSQRQQTWQPQKRQLGVLFMASSPEDVQPVLDFEAEESGILQATAHKPLDLQVEESGSLQGLEERLREREDSPDVIHFSGHADIDHASGQPVFLLEDEVGNCAPATPLDLARTFQDANSAPRVVFLSGCRTGESNQQGNMLSFSEQVVQVGVPVVLGWALPVGDVAASQAAAALYDKLAISFGIAKAVAFARQQLLENHSPYWHLLRAYVDSSTLNPLVAKGNVRLRIHNTPQQFLDAGGRVAVCARENFVGRRRLLQRSLRCLRAGYDNTHYAEGVLLHGMGGLGKSSAAARLVDRLRSSHEAVVCYGGLDETVLVAALGKALPKAQSLLNDAQQTLEQRLRELFEPREDNPYCTKPLLLVFDDFEQNIPLELRKQSKVDYAPASLRVLHTVLQAIHDSQSDTRVIATSRFEVPVPHPCRWHSENPQTLHAVDLKKKLAQLPGLQLVNGDDRGNALRERAVEIAAGNPRLLEWLDKVLRENALDTPALLDKLAQEEVRFREEVLISALVEAQTSAVRHTLACAALYRLPVVLTAIEALNAAPQTAQHLQTAARVGLVEITPTLDGDHYFVSNLLDSALADTLDVSERQPLAAKASQFLFAQEENAETLVLKSEALALETVRLSVLGKEQNIAIEMSDKFYPIMLNQYRYQEVEAMCQLVLTLGDEFRILSALASTEQCLGRSEAAQHFERALQIIPKIETSTHHNTLWEIASAYLHQVNFLQRRGDLEVAMMFLQEYVLPIYEKLGDAKSKAMTLGRIADILEASEQFEEALHLYEKEVLPIYKADRDVLSIAMTKSKIADILQTQGQLDEALQIRLIEVLPNFEKCNDPRLIAVEKGKIAEILQAYGQFDEALDIRENYELPVYEKLGDVRELLIGRINLAILLWQMDAAANAPRVQELLCLALTDARRLQIPEAGTIENILEQMGLSCDQ